MHAFLERKSPISLDSTVNSLSWRGNEKNGWLAVGNANRVVGVTYTEIQSNSDGDDTGENSELEAQNMRRNFNFREHAQNVTIVRWNKHLDKIATCDSLGSVIVWRNQEGRSIMELVNHRGIAISDFQWSNDGQKVLISYTDGYVLVGTATGRRLWARRLNIGTYVTHNTTPARTSELLSSTWSADDSRVVVGSSIGELIELDANDEGRLISTTEVLPGIGIIGLQWVRVPDQNRPERLSLYLKNGKVVLMSSCGDQHATIIKTGLIEGCMQWSEDGNVLAVAGYRRTRCQSTVRFFSPSGSLLFTLPLGTKKYVTALTWGHANKKLFLATGQQIHVATVQRTVPTLQALCRQTIAQAIGNREASLDLNLPSRMKTNIIDTFQSAIQGHVPEADNQLGYVSKAPPQGHRLFCTVKPNFAGSSQSSGNSRHRHASSYTLYVEHLGSLLPILVATRRNTKIRQSFTISLANSVKPRTNGVTPSSHKDFVVNGFVALETPGEHSGEDIHAQTPPRDPREHVTIHPQLSIDIEEEGTTKTTFRGMGIDYHNPGASKETRRTLDSQAPDVLAEVISNMMSSKFRIQGCCHQLPVDIGSVSIKTSLLHIQPRKVTVLLPKVDTCDSGIETDISDSSSEDEDVFDDLLEGNAQISGQTTLRKFSSRRLSSSPDPGIILNSKTPTWNDQHMIYQLDFGGRVTTKSAKNFQLEYGDKQVLQFGRIENGSFILDFQAPFSPIQAFAVALANLC